MHKLTRNPQSPRCLSKYLYGRNNWGDLTSLDKEDIWISIHEMQGHRCAYCEAALGNREGHIEHFYQRKNGHSPQLIFHWANLFGSCYAYDSCGNHKDNLASYNSNQLIKPDVDDPEDFLVFVADDGRVQPKAGLSNDNLSRAEETIRVFNLNSPSLCGRRAKAVGGALLTLADFQQMAEEFDAADWQPLHKEELARATAEPFCTAIRHALTL